MCLGKKYNNNNNARGVRENSFKNISAVKRLIQNKSFDLHNVSTVYIYYVYINTHTCMYINTHTCMYINTHTCMYINTHTCMYIFMKNVIFLYYTNINIYM